MPLGEVPDDDQVDVASLVEVPAGEVPDLPDHPESDRLAALQIESAYAMHSSASSRS
ncbi:hypothetical protein [Methanoculleus sp. UBA300]|uniref:hypothetical protein n=1 Tax=Methanoculleus sp. UBA300 TaxID=1915496 RepID=UPI00319EA3A6